MAILHVTADNFEELVIKSEKPVLVDFWAAWCGPCKMLAPALEELANAHPEVAVAKVNVDEEMELALGFRVSAIPALMVFKDGKVVKNAAGVQSRAALEELIKV